MWYNMDPLPPPPKDEDEDEEEEEASERSRITLYIMAHGTDVGEKDGDAVRPFPFVLPANRITLLNCGGGQCGSATLSYGKTVDELLASIQAETRAATAADETDTVRTMRRAQTAAKQIYRDAAARHRPSALDYLTGTRKHHRDTQKLIADDAHCKMYHPLNDRYYKFKNEHGFVMNHFIPKRWFQCTILQVLDSPHTDLVGQDLFDPVLLDRVPVKRDEPLSGVRYRFFRNCGRWLRCTKRSG